MTKIGTLLKTVSRITYEPYCILLMKVSWGIAPKYLLVALWIFFSETCLSIYLKFLPIQPIFIWFFLKLWPRLVTSDIDFPLKILLHTQYYKQGFRCSKLRIQIGNVWIRLTQRSLMKTAHYSIIIQTSRVPFCTGFQIVTSAVYIYKWHYTPNIACFMTHILTTQI